MKPVKHKEGHALVIAVPGSGKSTSMVARILHLIESGVKGSRIYCVMFNAAACEEFEGKLKKQLPHVKDKDLPKVKTFHRCGTELINLLTPTFLPSGYKFTGNVYAQRTAAKEVLGSFLNDDWRKVAGHLDDFVTFIDLVKSSSDSAAQVFSDSNGAFTHPWYVDAYEEFEKRRIKAKVRYFADLIYDPMMEVIRNPKARQAVSGLMEHLIVDEYQDINEIQQQMIKALAGDAAQTMAVGDPDQCIYAWRGARPDFILNRFHVDFPNPTIYNLTRTFRYGHPMSLAANYVITNNIDRVDQLCVSAEGIYPTELSLEIESMKKPKVPEILAKWCADDPGHSRKDAAVLVRNYSHAIPVEISLLNEGIPYKMDGGTAIFLRDEMAAILCALKIAAGTLFKNPAVDVKLVQNFLQHPPINLSYEDKHELVFEKMMPDPDNAVERLSELKFRAPGPGLARQIDDRVQLWRNLASLSHDPASELITYYFNRSNMERHFRFICRTPEQFDEKLQLFETFTKYAQIKEDEGLSLKEFVQHIDDLVSQSAKMEELDDPILITSCHKSKGLEWPLVIMCGLSEGRFPFIPREKSKPVSMEDERRLFYVAMTRAKKRLCMVIPNDPDLLRWLGNVNVGAPEGLEACPETASRFLYESNIFLAQLAPQIVKEGRLPAKLAGTPGAAMMQRYLDNLA